MPHGEHPPSLHAWSSGLFKVPPHTRPRASPPAETPASLPPGVAITLWLQGGPASRGRPKQIPGSQSRGFLCDWTYTCSPFLLSLLGTQERRGTATAGRGPWVQSLCAKVNGPLNCPRRREKSDPRRSGARLLHPFPLSSAPRRPRDRTVAVISPHRSLHALRDKLMLCML